MFTFRKNESNTKKAIILFAWNKLRLIMTTFRQVEVRQLCVLNDLNFEAMISTFSRSFAVAQQRLPVSFYSTPSLTNHCCRCISAFFFLKRISSEFVWVCHNMRSRSCGTLKTDGPANINRFLAGEKNRSKRRKRNKNMLYS